MIGYLVNGKVEVLSSRLEVLERGLGGPAAAPFVLRPGHVSTDDLDDELVEVTVSDLLVSSSLPRLGDVTFWLASLGAKPISFRVELTEEHGEIVNGDQ